MSIFFETQSRTFHLTNPYISYLIKIMPNDQLGQLYFGKAVNHSENFISNRNILLTEPATFDIPLSVSDSKTAAGF